MPSVTANLDHPSPSDQIETTRQGHPWGHSAPRQCKASYGQHNHGTRAEIQVGGSRSPSIQSRPLSLRLCHFWSPKKGSEGQTIHLGQRCRTVSQCSPGNFTRQPFTALCHSGASASTTRANTSDIQVLVSVLRPLDHFFFNAPYIIGKVINLSLRCNSSIKLFVFTLHCL